MGGLSRRVALVEKIRKEEKQVLVVDSGDLFFRNVPEGKDEQALAKARLMARVYRKMDVAALNVGDLDLARGVEFLAESGLPFVSANIRSAGGNALLFPSYRIREYSGIRIGFFGLTHPEFHADLPPAMQDRILIADPVQAARDMVDALRNQADVVVLLSDLGSERDRYLATQVPGIHFILGGHDSHATAHPHREGDTHLMQSWVKGMYLGVLRLTLEKPGLPFRDRGTPVRLRNQLRHLDQSISSLEKIRKSTPAPPPNIAAAILDLSAQRRKLASEEQALSPASYTKGNLFLWDLILLEQSLPVDGEIQAWIREAGLEAGEEEKIIQY